MTSRISGSAFLAAAFACVTWWHPWLPPLADRNEADDSGVSRWLAANTSNLEADVLLVLDFTVPPLHRRQQQEFAAALIGNVSAEQDWHLHFGVVVFHEMVKYELPLSDDYSWLRAQLLDPSFGASFGSQSLRSTDGALQLCSDVIKERDMIQSFSRSNVLVLLTAGVSKYVSGTLMKAAELKLEQGVTIYAIALDDLDGRVPTRISELSGLATDSLKEFNAKFSPDMTSTTSSTGTTLTATSSTGTRTTLTVTSSTRTTLTVTSSTGTTTTLTVTSSTRTTLTATSSTGTTLTTTSSTTNETNETNATTTTTTRTSTFANSNATWTQNTDTTTTTFSSTSLDDRRLRQLFGNSTVIDIGDLGFVLGESLVNFFEELKAAFNTSTTMGDLEPPGIGNLDGGIVVLIVLSTCCFIAVMMGIAYYAWYTMRHSADVEDLDIRGTPVVPAPGPAPPRPAAPPPRDATQKALKEAIDMQDLGKIRSVLSEILLKGWPEKKYTDLVLKALEVVGTLKESAAEPLQEAVARRRLLPQDALANARLAGVVPELVQRAEQLPHRAAPWSWTPKEMAECCLAPPKWSNKYDPNFKSIFCMVSQPKDKWQFPTEKHGGPPNAKQKHMQMGGGSFVRQLDLGPHAMIRISKFEVQFTLFHINAKRKAFTNATFSAFFSRFVCQHPSTSCTRKKHKESTTGSGCATCRQISLFLPAFWLKQLTARYANGSVYDSAWAVGKLTKTDETQSHMCLCQQCGLWNPFQEFSIQTDAGFLEKCVHV